MNPWCGSAQPLYVGFDSHLSYFYCITCHLLIALLLLFVINISLLQEQIVEGLAAH